MKKTKCQIFPPKKLIYAENTKQAPNNNNKNFYEQQNYAHKKVI